MAKGIKFNWQCAHCGKRDIAVFKFQFDIPKFYSGTWFCPKCGKETKINFHFTTEAIFKKKQEDKKDKKDKNNGS